jgi:hypothetical protein
MTRLVFFFFFKSGPKGPKVQNPSRITLFTVMHHISSFLFASPSSPSSRSSRRTPPKRPRRLLETRILHEVQGPRLSEPQKSRILALKAELHHATLQNGVVPTGSFPSISTGVISNGSFGVQAQSNLLKAKV